MTEVEQYTRDKSSEEKGIRSLKKSELETPFFILSGFGAGYVSAMTGVAAAYDSHSHSLWGIVSHYSLGLIFLPCFLIALLRSRWASIPLWVCGLLIIVLSYFHTSTTTNGIGTLQPGLGIFLTPALAEVARYLRARQSKT